MKNRKLTRVFTALLCAVLVMMVFPITASADTGPKPSVRITFENLGDKECWGTLLSSKQSTGPSSAWNGKEEDAQHNENPNGYYSYQKFGYDVWKAFVDYAENDDFYFLQEAWQINETKELTWTYYPPNEFKILLYFPETGEYAVSGVYERYAFDSYFTVNMEGVKLTVDYNEELSSDERINAYNSYNYRIEIMALVLEGIYADKGITGTSYKKRDEFNRMIRRCKQGKIDMIIVKSIARFARNTVDCLKFVRMLNDLGVVVYFEEQGIYTNQPGAEFYITIYGCIAQSESENISANVKWGKARSAKEGNVPFHYKNFLGYRKGADGKPEIDPEEAETVRFIYERFLAGDSLGGIAQKLEDMQIPSPKGKAVWSMTTIQSILSNEKYKGDAVINKTYIKDCLSKKVMVNNGERPKYYIENNHPAIIDAVTFGRVQEELARRAGKPKTKKVGTKTEQGKYSSKYAMTELLVCGECKTPYRRCTWTVKGQKKIVWRCINRLDFGKKYCHNSPTVEESILQRAVMRAIMETAQQNLGVLQTLKVHIGMALENEPTEDNSMELQIRIAEIDAEFKAMLSKISTETVDAFDEEKAKRLMDEKVALQQQLADIQDGQLKREQTQTRLDDIYTILDGLKNRPMEYDEQIVRQLLECITVDSKEQITVIFVGGLKVVQPLID